MQSGEVFAERWVLEADLGPEDLGEVFVVRDLVLERRAELKVLRPELVHDSEARARFEREAREGALPGNPTSARVQHLGEVDGVPYLVRDHVAPPAPDQTQVLRLPSPPSPPKGSSRRPWLVAAAGIVVIAFAVGLIAGTHRSGSGSPGTANGSASPTTGTPLAALVAKLPTAVYTNCVADPDRQGSDTPTATSCVTPGSGVDQLLVTQWSSAAAMAADFTTTYGGKPDGKCGSYRGTPPSGIRSTYGGGSPLACYLNTNGAAVVLWEYPKQAIQVVALRKDGNAAATFSWWLKAVATPLS